MIKKFIIRNKDILNKRRGQGLVEYAMIIGVVAVIVITLIGSIGKSVFVFISTAIQKITQV